MTSSDVLSNRLRVSSETWIVPGCPIDSSLDAKFTESPQISNENFDFPITPDRSGCRVLAITGHAVKRDDQEAHSIESNLDPATAFLARDRQIYSFD